MSNPDERQAIAEHERREAMRGADLVAACPCCGVESREALRQLSCPRCGSAWLAEGSRDPVPSSSDWPSWWRRGASK